MAFRYINPGYGDLTGDSSVTTFESSVYNPVNGVAFQKYNASSTTDIKIALPQAFTTDIYGKFNLYYDYTNTSFGKFRLGAWSTYLACMGVGINNGYFDLYAGQDAPLNAYIKLEKLSFNTIWFHLHRGENAASSYGELIVNDISTTAQFQNYHYTYPFSTTKEFFIRFPSQSEYGDKIYISELIISDEEISPKEKIIALPTNTTVTDMAAGASGIYLASAANQSLLQTPDVATLIENYGETSKVTGIAVVGNPAYRTGTAITSLIGLSKSGGVITEHDTCELSEDMTATVMDGWSLSGVTIADLQHMQFGWKAGE